MGTRKLELKDICGYLPYDLLLQVKEPSHVHDNQIAKIDSISKNMLRIKFDKSYIYDDEYIKDCFPILHPISDLYKTITHNGKEIVPIVELAKIFIEGLDWKLGKTINNYSYCAKYEDWYFDFNGRFMYYDEESNYEISNDWKLYDYLHELKIDYRGLIDAGLAVDVNTLNENPYK